MIRTNCPSCAAELVFVSKASLYAICRACGNMSIRKDLDVELIGEVAHLQDDGSPVQIGTRGAFQGAKFEVVGRIQLQFPFGFWNEWHILFSEDKAGWLGEAQGNYCVTFLTPSMDRIPPFASLRPDQPLQINGEAFIVKDLQEAVCVGGEGELPFKVEFGYRAPVADIATHTRRFGTIDYSEDPPLLFLGETALFDELQFRDLKPLEGW